MSPDDRLIRSHPARLAGVIALATALVAAGGLLGTAAAGASWPMAKTSQCPAPAVVSGHVCVATYGTLKGDGERSVFTVPRHVRALTIAVWGAAGGGTLGGPADLGGLEGAFFTVRPGEKLILIVGGTGGSPKQQASTGDWLPGKGGFGGGGAGGQMSGVAPGSSGGGGGSFVFGPHGVLLIAAGGGGGEAYCSPAAVGGNGGDAGSPGVAGQDGASSPESGGRTGHGGGGGTSHAGGKGGKGNPPAPHFPGPKGGTGANGTGPASQHRFGMGGRGGHAVPDGCSAGGGGGGYYGGGGGGGGGSFAGVGGGGGGSGYLDHAGHQTAAKVGARPTFLTVGGGVITVSYALN